MRRNPAAALPVLPIDRGYLSSDIALVLDVGSTLAMVDSATDRSDFERDLTRATRIRE